MYCIASSLFQIGLIGLVEEEWIATLAAIDKDEVVFHDYVTSGKRLAMELRMQEVSHAFTCGETKNA